MTSLFVVPDDVAQLVARRLADLRCCQVGGGRGPWGWSTLYVGVLTRVIKNQPTTDASSGSLRIGTWLDGCSLLETLNLPNISELKYGL